MKIVHIIHTFPWWLCYISKGCVRVSCSLLLVKRYWSDSTQQSAVEVLKLRSRSQLHRAIVVAHSCVNECGFGLIPFLLPASKFSCSILRTFLNLTGVFWWVWCRLCAFTWAGLCLGTGCGREVRGLCCRWTAGVLLCGSPTRSARRSDRTDGDNVLETEINTGEGDGKKRGRGRDRNQERGGF